LSSQGRGVEDRRVLEQVFDRRTLITLHHLMNRGFFQVLNGAVGTGKEARVYWGSTRDGGIVAVKIFATVAAEFRRRLPYIEGDPRFHRMPKTTIGRIDLWARKEFRNLQLAHGAGVACPRPITVRNNVLVMEFIGEDGVPAPLMAHVEEVNPNHYSQVLENVKRLYRSAGLVHADLSEYNVFIHQGRAILFDFGSAVDLRHPRAHHFLMRDITTINRFFSKRGIPTNPSERLFTEITGESPPVPLPP
jgi:RIO kinase 1